jgi:hypothetical protein
LPEAELCKVLICEKGNQRYPNNESHKLDQSTYSGGKFVHVQLSYVSLVERRSYGAQYDVAE